MLAKVLNCAIVGLEGAIVEVDISPSLPQFTIVSLPDTAAQEARERVRAAIQNSGCTFPMKRISGPFIDQVDIFVEVPHINHEKLADDRLGEQSDKVQARVKATRSLQLKRFQGTRLIYNAEMTLIEARESYQTEESVQSLLKAAMKQLYLSTRAFHRILKLIRAIADLENAE